MSYHRVVTEKISWKRVIYFGSSGGASIWQASDESGAVVTFIAANDQLPDVLAGLKPQRGIVGVDVERHAELREMLTRLELEQYEGTPPAAPISDRSRR